MNTPVPKGDASARRDRDPDGGGARDFNLKRRDWFARVRAGAGVPKTWAVVAVAHYIAFDLARGPGSITGQSAAGIGAALGGARRQTIDDAVGALKTAGYLDVRPNGWGRPQAYTLVFPEDARSQDATDGRQLDGPKGGLSDATRGRQLDGGSDAPPDATRSRQLDATETWQLEGGRERASDATRGRQIDATHSRHLLLNKLSSGRDRHSKCLSPSETEVCFETSVPVAGERTDEAAPSSAGTAGPHEAAQPPDPIKAMVDDFIAIFPNAGRSEPDEIRAGLVTALDAGFRPHEVIRYAASYSEAARAGGFAPAAPTEWLARLVAGDDGDA